MIVYVEAAKAPIEGFGLTHSNDELCPPHAW